MARRSLGTLTLDLIAQIGGFEKGMDKANRKSKQTMGAMQKHAKMAAKAVAGIGIAAVGATAALVKSQANAADELIKTSRAVGVEVEALSALKYQAELSGVQFNNLATGLRTFSKNARDAAEGTGEAKDTFELLGISLYDTDGRLKTTEVLLGDVANAFSGMEDGMLKTAAAQDLMGRSGAQMINLLNGGADGMAAARKEAEALGQVLDKETAEGAEAFNDALTRTKKALFDNYDLLTDAAPAMQEFAEIVSDPETIAGLKSMISGMVELAGWMAKLATSAASFANTLGERTAEALHGPALDDLEGQIRKANTLQQELADLQRETVTQKQVGVGAFISVKSVVGSPEEIARVKNELTGVNAQIKILQDQKAVAERFTLFEKESAELEKITSLMMVFGDTSSKAGEQATKAGEDIADRFNKAAGEVKYAADEIARATTFDEFGFSGNENPFDDSTWQGMVDGAKDIEDAWGRALDAVFEGVSRVQGALEDGSDASKKLGVALQALAVVQGVVAVVNQGGGDPYTAFARMAAMAAAVASLGIQVQGTFAGGSGDVSAQAQQVQGTGTVFGDPAAKSESILQASEFTADAVGELVGINRDQLQALQAMVAGITSATNMVVRGVDQASLPGQNASWTVFEAIDPMHEELRDPGKFLFGLELDFAGDFLADLLGGSSEVINQGIAIVGGYIADLANNVVVSAFQDVEEKKHIFDDTDVRRFSEQLGAGVGEQFELVFASMVNAVTASASVLGVAQSVIDERVAAFQVAAQEISLKDLTAAEQQEELNAIFSSIFDGLAVSVVPYIDDFAQAGEGYGETLARVATQVQVAEEAVTQLGISLGENLTPQQLAQAADELVNLGGGLSTFINNMQSFVQAFATDEHKLFVATNSIESAFEQLGLGALPQSEEALWALMDGLTDPAQINGLLGLTDAFKTYFAALTEEGAAAVNERDNILKKQIELAGVLGESELSLAASRQLQLQGMSESVAAMQRQIWAEQDLAAARAEAVSQTDRALLALRTATDADIQASADRLAAANNELTADHEARVNSINSWFDSIIDRYQRRAESLQDSISALTGLSGSLESAVDSLRNKTATSEQAGYLAAVAELGGLASGVAAGTALPGANDINRIAGSLGNGADYFSDYSDFVQSNAEVLRDLQYLQGKTDTQLSIEERALLVAEQRAESAQRNHEVMLAREDERLEQELAEAQALHDAEVAELEKQYKQFEEQINQLRSIDTGVLDVNAAVQGVIEAIDKETALRNSGQQALVTALRDGFESGATATTDVFNTVEQFLEEWREAQTA